MRKIEVETIQHLTQEGRQGAVLFVGGPIASAVGYAIFLHQISSGPYGTPVAPLLMIGAGGIGFLVGCIMLLAGRTYVHEIKIGDEDEKVDT